MTRRYYAHELPSEGGIVSLSSEESRHAIKVMRIEIGEKVALFDGCGSESMAEVVELTRDQCRLRTEPAQPVNREPHCEIHLAIALPKPDRSRELIERLTELGVKTVTPLIAQRTQRPPSASVLQKLRRGVIEACKQCGRNQLLEVRDPLPALDFFATSIRGVGWIAHPTEGANPMAEARSFDRVTAAVGPEGGWTEDEIAAAIAHGYRPIHLGKRIYRIETAATVIAAMLTD